MHGGNHVVGRSSAPYLPGLDGLRAFAVAAVVLFHIGFEWARGGFLGVSLFFTLSGFLITGLLLDEHQRTGRIDVVAFWARRLRRLAPAALACLALVLAGALTWRSATSPRVPGDVTAAALSVANWRFVAARTSYAELFTSRPSPVLHFWSLAIEEQFYLAFPLVLAGVLAVRRLPTAAVLGGLAAAATAAAVLTGDRDLDYYGTHVRAAELLVGALLAVAARAWTRPARGVPAAGAAAAAAFVLAVASVGQGAGWLYRGGLAALAVAVWCPLIVAVTGTGWMARLCASRPLAAIGRRSYGIYLYHWPVLVLLDAPRLGTPGWVTRAAQAVVVAGLTELSYRWLERPVRERRRLVTGTRCRRVLASSTATVIAAAVLLPVPGPAQLAVIDAPDRPVVLAAAPVAATDAPAATTPATAPGPTTLGPPISAATAPVAEPPRLRVVVLGDAPQLAATATAHLAGDAEVVDRTGRECFVLVDPDASAAACRTDVASTPADVVIVGVGAGQAAHLAASIGAAPERTPELIRWYGVLDERLTELAAAAPRVLLVDAIDDTVLDRPAEGPTAAKMLRHSLRATSLTTTTMTAHTAAELPAALAALAAPVAAERLRVMVIGDSTAYALAAGMAGSGRGLSVLWAGHVACPLVATTAIMLLHQAHPTGDCPTVDDWRTQAGEFAPDVVLAVSSIAEPTAQRYPGDDAWHEPGDAAYATAHDRWLADVTAALGAARLAVATAPDDVPGGPVWVTADDIATWNRQVRAWEALGAVDVVDYAALLAGAEAAAGGPLRPDGAHLDEATAAVLGTTIAGQLLAGGTR